MARRILVVGGGISGLSLAHALVRDGEERGVEVGLVEASEEAGGTLGSTEEGGFVFERGPNGFLDGVPWTLELARELGLEGELIAASPAARNRYVLRDGRLLPLPRGPLAFLRSPVLSLRGRLRVLREPFVSPRREEGDESVGAFGRRRFGQEATDVLLDPLVTGIFAGDVDRVSIRSAFPRVAALEAEHGSVFRGLRAQRRRRRQAERVPGGDSPPGDGAGTGADGGSGSPGDSGRASGPLGGGGTLRSFRGGLGELARALVGRLGGRVRLGWAVESVTPHARGGFDVALRGGERETWDAVVLAVPAPRASALVARALPELGRSLEAIPYAPVAVVCLGWESSAVERPLDGFGFLVPRREGLRSLGMIWTSSVFPDHAPDGHASLRVLVGGARDAEAVGLSADDLEALVRRELGGVVGLRGEPVARRVWRWMRGIPQYDVGHGERVDRIEREAARVPGLFLTGNAYHGVGINDCVRESGRVAREVLRWAGETSSSAVRRDRDR